MIKAYAYLRVSGQGQISGNGFTRQLETIEGFAEKAGIEVIGVYKEKGVSGTNDFKDRPAFMKMVSDILNNGVSTIIIEGLDRLARELRARAKITSHFRWRDRVVPIWALSIPFQKDLPHLLVRHLFPFVVMFVDKRRADFQSRRSFSGTNEFQHSFVIKQRLSCPVVTNERKHTVFNRIPLRGTGRIMTNLDLKAESVAKSNLQLLFPKADSVAIAAAAISENEQSVGIRVVA